MSWGTLEVAGVSVFHPAGGGGLSGDGKVLGEEVVQVWYVGKLVCAGGVWGPALTSLPCFCGQYSKVYLEGVCLLGRQGRHLGGGRDCAGLQMCSKCLWHSSLHLLSQEAQ